MAWSEALQARRDQFIVELIERCREEVGDRREITSDTDPCHHLGICEEDLDDVQIDAAARLGMRPPHPGEPLVIPWQGPGDITIADLAAWLAVNGRPLHERDASDGS